MITTATEDITKNNQTIPDDHDWELRNVDDGIPYFQCKSCNFCLCTFQTVKGEDNHAGLQSVGFMPPQVEINCPPDREEEF